MNMLGVEFRTKPNLKLIPYNRLTSDFTNSIVYENLFNDGFGVALHAANEVQAVEIDEISALLLFVMQHDGCLPDFILEEGDSKARSRVFELILAGVLQLKLNGQYYSTHSALKLLRNEEHDSFIGSSQTQIPNQSTLRQMSIKAIESVILSGELDLRAVQSFLYRYNTIPISRKLKKQFEDGAFEFNDLMSRDVWSEVDRKDGWIYYHQRQTSSAPSYQAKLYVSPKPADFKETLQIVINKFAEHKDISFKVGTGISGLVRSDKIVAYIPDKGTLIEVSQKLTPLLQHIQVHGVPFTAECTVGGVLSWGVDPHSGMDQEEIEHKSWRQWIVEKIADSLRSIDLSFSELPATDKLSITLDRLALAGVDLKSFGPNSSWIKTHLPT